MADEVDRLTELNQQQAKRIAELERVNEKLYENVELFVTRRVINDYKDDYK